MHMFKKKKTTCSVCLHSIQLALPTSPTPLLPGGVCTVARQICLSISLPVFLTPSLIIAPVLTNSFIHSQPDVICQTVFVRSSRNKLVKIRVAFNQVRRASVYVCLFMCISVWNMILHECYILVDTVATVKTDTFFTLTQSLLLAGLYSHCVMDYARLEFGGGGGGGGGINALPCNDQTEALCMFTPMHRKRIIHGLVQCVVGVVIEMVPHSVIATDDIIFSVLRQFSKTSLQLYDNCGTSLLQLVINNQYPLNDPVLQDFSQQGKQHY